MTTAPSSAVFSIWYEHSRWGAWPRAGGWLDQPLNLLVQMQAIDFVLNTKRYSQKKDVEWKDLSELQRQMISWLEKTEQD